MNKLVIRIFLICVVISFSNTTLLAILTPSVNKNTSDLDRNEFKAIPIHTNYTHYYLVLMVFCQNCIIDLLILENDSFNIFSVDGDYSYQYKKSAISHIEERIQLQKDKLFYIVLLNNKNTKAIGIDVEFWLQNKELNLFTMYLVIFLIIASNSFAILLVIHHNSRINKM